MSVFSRCTGTCIELNGDTQLCWPDLMSWFMENLVWVLTVICIIFLLKYGSLHFHFVVSETLPHQFWFWTSATPTHDVRPNVGCMSIWGYTTETYIYLGSCSSNSHIFKLYVHAWHWIINSSIKETRGNENYFDGYTHSWPCTSLFV